MPKCIVSGCNNKQRRGKKADNFTLHVFPFNDDRRIKSWLRAIGQDFGDVDEMVRRIKDPKTRNAFRVCSEHFASDAYHFLGVRQCLKPDSIPSVFQRTPSPKEPDLTETSTSSQSSTGSETLPPTLHSNPVLQTKRVLEHDHTDKSNTSPYKGRTSKAPLLQHRSTCTERYHGVRCVSTQTSLFHGKKNKKNSTEELITKKDASTWTGPLEDLLEEAGYLARTVGSTEELQAITTPARETVTDRRFPTPSKMGSLAIPRAVRQEKEEGAPDADAMFDSAREPDLPTEYEVDVGELSFIADPSVEDFVVEKKFLVFENCLDDLLRRLNKCAHSKACDAPVARRRKTVNGTLLTVYGICGNHHESELWRSQPTVGSRGAGNLLCSASILFSGGEYAKVAEMFKIIGMPFISKSTHLLYQKHFQIPVIDLHYKREQQANIRSLRGRALCLTADRYCDNPGLSAKYCTYSLLEEKSNKIIECQTVEVPQTTPSLAMKTKAFRRCVNNLLSQKLEIGIIATDRHAEIRRIMRAEHKQIRHEFDLRHYCRRLSEKLTALSEKKSCRVLGPWTQWVVDHLWNSSSGCKGDVDALRERWNSLLRHVCNMHEWDDGVLLHACDHKPTMEDEEHNKEWLRSQGGPYRHLESLVMNKNLQEDLEHLSHFCHAGGLEVFHNMVLKYRPKRTPLSMDEMVSRTKLAVLAHNNNVNKHHACAKRGGTGGGREFRRCPYFPKRSKKWPIKHVCRENTFDYVDPMMADVLRLASGETTVLWDSLAGQLPPDMDSSPPAKRPLVQSIESHLLKSL